MIIVTLSENGKNEIMKYKNKLHGTSIFIDNDLDIETRKKQEEINLWVKEKRGLGWQVKTGIGRVFINGRWRRWEEKSKIERETCESLERREFEKSSENNNNKIAKRGDNETNGAVGKRNQANVNRDFEQTETEK